MKHKGLFSTLTEEMNKSISGDIAEVWSPCLFSPFFEIPLLGS